MILGCLILTVIKQIWRYIYASIIYKDTCLRVPGGNRNGLKCTQKPYLSGFENIVLYGMGK